MRFAGAVAVLVVAMTAGLLQAEETSAAGAAFSHGLPQKPGFFPIAVWLQSPANAARYKAIGINTYVGLWRGPTDEQLAALEKAGMLLICSQSERSLAYKDRACIIAWMHGDEPDNAQSRRGGGYGPPIAPERIVEDYQKIRKVDPTRPVLLNLGQGVAWDNWVGRGVRTNHPEDYAQYVKGCDIASFDIYPAVHDKPQVAGNLWYVPFGVDRLRKWCGDDRPVWTCIECTRISNPKLKPTPQQVRAEVWMALIHGARGLIYFCHEFQPKFIEAGLLADAEMARAVGEINRQIQELAPVLNSPELRDVAAVSSSADQVPIDITARRQGGATYVFAAAMRNGTTTGSFTVAGMTGKGKVTVIGEQRAIEMTDGKWRDAFEGYGVHLYRIEPAEAGNP